MPFSYHPPTRNYCEICENLPEDNHDAIIDSKNGKASAAKNFPFHNWYNFVLGYTPQFPDYILSRENVNESSIIADPFMGSGTTLVACKNRGISSIGLEANEYFIDVANTKLDWDIDTNQFSATINDILQKCVHDIEMFNFPQLKFENEQFDFLKKNGRKNPDLYAKRYRPEMLTERYMSNKPFVKAHIISKIINSKIKDIKLKNLFTLALSSILVKISNIYYGPGFGVKKHPIDDIDVLGIFNQKLKRMLDDLENVKLDSRNIPAQVHCGDARQISNYFEENTIDLMITSPPYPGDHEYTKHTRIELIFNGYARTKQEFRSLKERMIRGSTTNIYKNDNEGNLISGISSIGKVVDLIDQRLISDGATSGFEKLYTKLVREYFGGMYKALKGIHKSLKPGGKIVLLVGDSHAFKMVHIQTANILSELGEQIGFKKYHIELWQDKISTSHKYYLRENILTLEK